MLKFIKDIIRSILINAFILYILNYYQFGILIETESNVFHAFLLLGGIFWVVNFLLKKILHILAFPLKLLTLGLFSIVINVGVLYFFQRFINNNYHDIASVTLSPQWIKVLILSFVVSLAYTLLSKLLK